MEKVLELLSKSLNCVYELIDNISRDNNFMVLDQQQKLLSLIKEINEVNDSEEFNNELDLRKAIEILQKKLVLKHSYTLKSGLVYYELDQKMEFDEEEFEILSKFIEVIK